MLSGHKINRNLQRTIFGIEKIMKRCDIVTLGYILSLWLYGRFFSFLILYTVGRTPRTGDQPVARPLPTHRTTQIQNKRTQTSMPWVGFKPTTPVFERAKTVHALDLAAIVIGSWLHWKQWNNNFFCIYTHAHNVVCIPVWRPFSSTLFPARAYSSFNQSG
jgi:hypothetical protein